MAPSNAKPLTGPEMGLNFGLVGVSCVAAQSTVHWSQTTMVRQQLAAMSAARAAASGAAAPAPLGMFATTAQIFRTEGVGGLYRGFSAAALRELSYSSLRFGLYEPLKLALGADPRERGALATAKKVLAGLGAGAFAAGVASPTDLLTIRMMRDTSTPPLALRACARAVLAEGGAAALYRGLDTTVTRAAILGATKMATYDEVKSQLRERAGWRDGPAMVFVASVAAGLAITITTSPATNARTMIMAGEVPAGTGMLSAVKLILRNQGPVGLYRGFGMQWLRFGPYAVVQFAAWEYLRLLCGMGAL